jgi:hypothetical protein
MPMRARTKFRPGRTGVCEAKLFEVTGRDELDHERRTEQVGAGTIQEVVTYLQRRHPHFRVASVQELGITVLLSGTPLD